MRRMAALAVALPPSPFLFALTFFLEEDKDDDVDS